VTDEPIPPVNGGKLSQIPVPKAAVVMCDFVYDVYTAPRYKGGNNFVFLDAHAEWIPHDKYWDVKAQGEFCDDHSRCTDHDGYGNRNFYCWGLTKRGFD
jgi:prepilin-type processing-associated H-X9-DG protein